MGDLHPPKTASAMPYVWAVVILFMFGVILIGTVLFLRPTYDPLVVIASVMGFVATASASVAAFLKTNETHREVNSKLTAWKTDHFKMAFQEGHRAGTETEQARVAEIRRIAALPGALPLASLLATDIPASLAPTAPIPVIIENPGAIPVKVTK